ncbi:MAG: HD domain-containing phosphohydrolase [Saccharospirillum sp.]
MMTTESGTAVIPHDTVTILCVDDEARVLAALKRVLSPLNARVEAFTHAQAALAFMRANSVSVIISDMRMPAMSGAEFLAEAFRLQPNAYRILITGYSDLTSTVSAVNDGRIQRYLSKPWSNDTLLEAVREGLSHVQLLEANYRLQNDIKQKNEALEQEVLLRTRQLRKAIRTLKAEHETSREAYQGALNVLTNALSVNPIADGHFHQNVSSLAELLASKLELSDTEIEQVRLAGLLVHLGLLGVDTGLLKKDRARLTVQERNELARHPQIAQIILSPAPHFNELAQVLGSQNEAYNGTGKPFGLVGETIPIGSRILTLARDFWRIANETEGDFIDGYKKGRRELKQGMGIRYDPDVVACFCELDPEQIQRFESRDQALTIDELEPGMVLLDDLYNSAGLLLLAKESILTEESISKLMDYQAVNDATLLIQAEATPECGTTLEQPDAASGV